MAVRIAAPSNRRSRHGGLIGAAFIGGSVIISTLIFTRSMNAAPKKAEAPVVVAEFDTVPIPVPVAAVPAGARVKNIRFKMVNFPQHQIPQGAVRNLAQIADASAVSPLPANLPVFDVNFSKTMSASNPVTERIPEGMRAMTIRVDATTAVEGWAGSGSLVDVLLITKDRTSVVAEKVKILSAERSVSPVEGGAAPSVPSTVTLLVTQDQCLAINTATPLGKIAFALRNASDDAEWNDPLFTSDRLRGRSSLKEEKKNAISGLVTVKGEEKHYALADGQWVKTDAVPAGFLIGQRDEAH